MIDIHVFDNSTGTGAIAKTIAPAARFRLVSIRLHLSAAPSTSQDFTATVDAVAGSAYDVVLYKRDLTVGSVTDLAVPFDETYQFQDGDEIEIAWTNTDAKTYGLTVVYQRWGS